MGDDLRELIVAMYEREPDHAFHIMEIVGNLAKDRRVSRQRVEQLHKRLVEGKVLMAIHAGEPETFGVVFTDKRIRTYYMLAGNYRYRRLLDRIDESAVSVGDLLSIEILCADSGEHFIEDYSVYASVSDVVKLVALIKTFDTVFSADRVCSCALLVMRFITRVVKNQAERDRDISDALNKAIPPVAKHFYDKWLNSRMPENDNLSGGYRRTALDLWGLMENAPASFYSIVLNLLMKDERLSELTQPVNRRYGGMLYAIEYLLHGRNGGKFQKALKAMRPILMNKLVLGEYKDVDERRFYFELINRSGDNPPASPISRSGPASSQQTSGRRDRRKGGS